MRVCPKCGEDVPKDKQYCQKCLFNMGFFEYFGYEQPGEGRIGQRFDHLHPKYFMRNDREWTKDIRSRRTLKDGSIGKFRDGKRYA